MFIDEEIAKMQSEAIRKFLLITTSETIKLLNKLENKLIEYNSNIKAGENDISKLINKGEGLKVEVVDKKDIAILNTKFKIDKIPVSFIKDSENPNKYKCVYFKTHEDLGKRIIDKYSSEHSNDSMEVKKNNKTNNLLRSVVQKSDVEKLKSYLDNRDVKYIFVKDKNVENKTNCFIKEEQQEKAFKAFSEFTLEKKIEKLDEISQVKNESDITDQRVSDSTEKCNDPLNANIKSDEINNVLDTIKDEYHFEHFDIENLSDICEVYEDLNLELSEKVEIDLNELDLEGR